MFMCERGLRPNFSSLFIQKLQIYVMQTNLCNFYFLFYPTTVVFA